MSAPLRIVYHWPEGYLLVKPEEVTVQGTVEIHVLRRLIQEGRCYGDRDEARAALSKSQGGPS